MCKSCLFVFICISSIPENLEWEPFLHTHLIAFWVSPSGIAYSHALLIFLLGLFLVALQNFLVYFFPINPLLILNSKYLLSICHLSLNSICTILNRRKYLIVSLPHLLNSNMPAEGRLCRDSRQAEWVSAAEPVKTTCANLHHQAVPEQAPLTVILPSEPSFYTAPLLSLLMWAVQTLVCIKITLRRELVKIKIPRAAKVPWLIQCLPSMHKALPSTQHCINQM